MPDAADAYSRINVDSPWRWFYTAVTLPFLVVTWIASALDSSHTILPILCLIPILVVLHAVKSKKEFGTYAPAPIVERYAQLTGGVRLNSRPQLSRTLYIAGVIMLVAFFAGLILFADGPRREQDTIQRLLLSPFMLGIGSAVMRLGRSRPWDLKVVEREPAA